MDLWKILIVTVLMMAPIGCASPLIFNTPSENPSWVNHLDSRIEEVNNKKIDSNTAKRKKGKDNKQEGNRQTVQDVVAPRASEPSIQNEKKPIWVGDLEGETQIEKVGKGKRPDEPKGQDQVKPPGVEDLQERVTVRKIGKGREREVPESDSEDMVDTELVPAPEIETDDADTKPPRNGKVDIVFIVDSSLSMDPMLRKVKKTFAGFIDVLEPLDWKIMFTNADSGNHLFFLSNIFSRKGRAMSLESDGRSLLGKKYLTKDMEDYRSIFIDTLRLHDHYEYWDNRGDQEKSKCELPPGCQGGNEQALATTMNAFQKNNSFFRADADIAVIIFSDSDEDRSQRQKEKINPEKVIRSFHDKWSSRDNKRITFYGIIMIPGEPRNCGYQGIGSEKTVGQRFFEMIEYTGGVASHICNSSYVPLAEQIVQDFQ